MMTLLLTDEFSDENEHTIINYVDYFLFFCLSHFILFFEYHLHFMSHLNSIEVCIFLFNILITTNNLKMCTFYYKFWFWLLLCLISNTHRRFQECMTFHPIKYDPCSQHGGFMDMN